MFCYIWIFPKREWTLKNSWKPGISFPSMCTNKLWSWPICIYIYISAGQIQRTYPLDLSHQAGKRNRNIIFKKTCVFSMEASFFSCWGIFLNEGSSAWRPIKHYKTRFTSWVLSLVTQNLEPTLTQNVNKGKRHGSMKRWILGWGFASFGIQRVLISKLRYRR